MVQTPSRCQQRADTERISLSQAGEGRRVLGKKGRGGVGGDRIPYLGSERED